MSDQSSLPGKAQEFLEQGFLARRGLRRGGLHRGYEWLYAVFHTGFDEIGDYSQSVVSMFDGHLIVFRSSAFLNGKDNKKFHPDILRMIYAESVNAGSIRRILLVVYSPISIRF